MITAAQQGGPDMRAPALALVIALGLVPAAAFAQAGPPGGPPPGTPEAAPPGGPGGPPPPPGAITREQFIARAEAAAARRFDEIDTNHFGYITRAQLRAFNAAQRRGPPPQ
jgi:hypothetical protein